MEFLFIFPMWKHIINPLTPLFTITMSLSGLLRMRGWPWLIRVTRAQAVATELQCQQIHLPTSLLSVPTLLTLTTLPVASSF